MLSRPLLTLHEVADLLKVKEATVRTWINNGNLRAVKFGREWRVAHVDLETFVEEHATRPSRRADRAAPLSNGHDHDADERE